MRPPSLARAGGSPSSSSLPLIRAGHLRPALAAHEHEERSGGITLDRPRHPRESLSAASSAWKPTTPGRALTLGDLLVGSAPPPRHRRGPAPYAPRRSRSETLVERSGTIAVAPEEVEAQPPGTRAVRWPSTPELKVAGRLGLVVVPSSEGTARRSSAARVSPTTYRPGRRRLGTARRSRALCSIRPRVDAQDEVRQGGGLADEISAVLEDRQRLFASTHRPSTSPSPSSARSHVLRASLRLPRADRGGFGGRPVSPRDRSDDRTPRRRASRVRTVQPDAERGRLVAESSPSRSLLPWVTHARPVNTSPWIPRS